MATYRKTPVGLLAHRKTIAKMQRKFPLKNSARAKVKYAVKMGYLKKPGHCEECSDTRIQAHHDDYQKPLDVRWVCSRHHADIHRLTKLGTFQ